MISFGRCIQGGWTERIVDLKLSAKIVVCHNRDAPKTGRAVVCKGGTVPPPDESRILWFVTPSGSRS
jgi:hypothetical protein